MTAWADRLADRSPSVQRSRDRSVKQAQVLVEAARRLVLESGDNFTTKELVNEAGVALQTFYRYFASKDELMLAVLEDLVLEACEAFHGNLADLDDPVDRLRSYVTSVFALLDDPLSRSGARFVASEHWRLAQTLPDEVTAAIKPFADLLQDEIAAGSRSGELRSTDPEQDAALISQLVLSVFHQHSFAQTQDPELADRVWSFCLHGLGGSTDADSRT
jgi:TetR/AcrR family transcriptional regulator